MKIKAADSNFIFTLHPSPLILFFFIVSSCSSDSDKTATAEYIVRLDDEHPLLIPPVTQAPKTAYPWQKEGLFQGITKEYFRCKGCSLNPPTTVTTDGKEVARFYDCGGAEKHSLPLRDGKEFIYPILIELLNHVQKTTKKAVIVTSGHRCLAHQSFLDPSPKGQSSKHMIGAEVDFYVQGLEDQPQKIAQILMDFYKGQTKEYQEFQRFEKNSDVSTTPWYNKEIFIKFYKPNEGRNADNQHAYPYLSLQVRFCREKNEKVVFSPEQAQKLLRK